MSINLTSNLNHYIGRLTECLQERLSPLKSERKAASADELDSVKRNLNQRQSPGGNHRRRPFRMCMVALLMAIPAASLADYLPTIGPAPLRFGSLPNAPVSGGLLLSLVAEPSPAAIPETAANAATNATTIPPMIQLEPVVTVVNSPGGVETNDVTKELMPSVSFPEANFMTPQTVLPFFQKKPGATNEVEPTVITPVMFIPPTRVQRSPSKATYSTP
jgi:hypothetical protein